LQQETLEQLTHKESMIDKETMTNHVEIKKSLDVKIQTLEKGTNTNPSKILLTNKSPKVPTDEGSNNKIQGCLIVIFIISASVLFNKLTKDNQYERLSEDPIILKRSSDVESYHFPNHRSHPHTVLQKIELGWSDPFTIRQFFSTRCNLYRLVLSTITSSRIQDNEKELQVVRKTIFSIKCFKDKAS